jgi:hypothetical protein
VTLTGHYRWALWAGWVLTMGGMGLFWLLTPTISIPGWIFTALVSGLGLGLLFPAMAFSIQAAVKPLYIASGVAFFSFFRAFGQAVGIAVGGTIFQNQIRQKILQYPLIAPMAAEYSQDATSLVGIIHAMADGEAKVQLILAYADALKIIWVVMAALAAVAMIASFFTKGYSLDQIHQTEQGFVETRRSSEEEKGEIAH